MNCSSSSTITCALFCLTLSAFGTQAHASNYIGIDGSSVTVDNTVDDDVNPRGVRFRLGTRISEVFDIEAHFGGAMDDDTIGFDELSTSYGGLYLKGYLPVGRRSAFFALAGGAAVELTQTIRGGEFSDDRSGFSYGFGLETELTSHLDLSADYMRYSLDDDEFSGVTAVNLGLKWYF